MRSILICTLVASATLGLSACNQAKSPQDVQADVAKATSEAADNSAKADANRQQAEAQASDQLAKDQAAAAQKAADSSVAAVTDAAVADAEGQNKIALAKCEALEGDAQKQCKDDANARLAAVKDRAKDAKKGPITP
jgi:predicted lipid-binding transport protein (Tim44 family)